MSPAPPLFDLVLLGYRNDVARERVLTNLRGLTDGSVDLGRDTPLPCVLRRGLDHTDGLRLLGVLRAQGAQVRLVTAESAHAVAPAPPPVAAPSPPAAASAPRRASVLPLLLVIFGLAVAAYIRFAPLPPPLPPPPAGTGSPELALAPPVTALDPAPHRLNDEAVRLNAAGQFSDAATRLRAALRQDPDEPALRRNLRIVLHNWAVAELNADHTESAVALLEEGLALEEDADLLGALGIARAKQGEWQPARAALERAVALGASDPYTFIALGKVYRQVGEREAAVDMFHRARERGAGGPEFQESLGRLERELDAEWDFTQMSSPHFQIAFAAGERESNTAAELVAHGLENAYFHVGRFLDLYPDERVPVVLYPSEEFHDVTQTPSWTSGVYDGRIKLPVGGIADGNEAVLTRTLRHEYGHVLVHQLSHGRCPVWLNEGIAIWSEEERDGDREDWAYQTLSGQVLFPLRDLEGPFTRLPADRVHVAYAQSYLAVRALVARSSARRVRELLADLGQGQRLSDAFRAVFYEEFAVFEGDLVRTLTQG